MLVALTGSSGCLGTEIAKQLLSDGHRVKGLDRRSHNRDRDGKPSQSEAFSEVEVDLTLYDAVCGALKGCDAVGASSEAG